MNSGAPIAVIVTEPEGASFRVRVALLHRIETEGRMGDPVAHLTDTRGVAFQARACDVRMIATGLVQLTVELRDEARRIRALADETSR